MAETIVFYQNVISFLCYYFYYNQRQECWEGYLFFLTLPPHHTPSFKVAVNANTKLTL